MDHYTLIITQEQKNLIAKALEVFSQLHLGQTSNEQRGAKDLEKLVARCAANRYGDTVNNLTG